MAATLYEPAFVIIGRAHEDSTRRLRALAAVTLVGGLASTVFLPVTGLSVAAIGWRGAVLVLAAMLAGSTWATRVWVFSHRPAPSTGLTPPQSAGDMPADESNPPGFLLLAAMFALASLAGAAFTSNVCTFALSVLLYARFAHKTDSPCRHASRQVLWKSRDDAAFRM
jgi:hypothetical protein